MKTPDGTIVAAPSTTDMPWNAPTFLASLYEADGLLAQNDVGHAESLLLTNRRDSRRPADRLTAPTADRWLDANEAALLMVALKRWDVPSIHEIIERSPATFDRLATSTTLPEARALRQLVRLRRGQFPDVGDPVHRQRTPAAVFPPELTALLPMQAHDVPFAGGADVNATIRAASLGLVPVPADATEFRGRRYKVFGVSVDDGGPATATEAARWCAIMGGRLAVPRDGDDNAFLIRLLALTGPASNSSEAFLGMSDAGHEGRWVDQKNRPLAISAWAPGEPNNADGNENHAVLHADGRWNDVSRAVAAPYICAWDDRP